MTERDPSLSLVEREPDEHAWIVFDSSAHCYGCGTTLYRKSDLPEHGCMPITERLRRYAENPNRTSRRSITAMISEVCGYTERLREAASRLAEGTRGYSETIGQPAKVVMFKGVEFINESPNEITLEPEGPMRMRIRALSTPPASPAATSGPTIDAKCLRCNCDLGHDPDCENCRRYCEWQAAASRPAQTWQPIESAPKDGTMILLAGDSGYVTTPLRIEVGYLDQNRLGCPVMTYDNTCWTEASDSLPTHWMPLPAPPGPGAQKKD